MTGSQLTATFKMGNMAASYHRSHISPEMDKRNFTIIGCVGLLACLTVAVEMCEKLSGSKTDNWSALRLMGPQIWLPLKTKEDSNIAIIILIFSFMYAASCGLLIYGGRERVKDLCLTWKLSECGVLMYQIIAAIITSKMFTVGDGVILTIDTVLGVLALIYTRVAEQAWQEEASGEDGRRMQPSQTPSEDVVAGPSGIPSPACRSSENVAGPSGASRPSQTTSLLPMQELGDDSDSLESVTAGVIEQPPPLPPKPEPQPTSTPRSKKTLVRIAQVTVHTPPADVQQVDVDRSLTSIPEESSSDQSRGSSTSAVTPPPSRQLSAAGKSEAIPDLPHAESTSTAPEHTEEASVAEVSGLQEATPSTGEQQTETQEEVSQCPLLSTEASGAEPEPPKETAPSPEHAVSTDEGKPSEERPSSAAEPSAADGKSSEEEQSATSSAASPMPPGDDGTVLKTPTNADASQVGAAADTGAPVVETTPGAEDSSVEIQINKQ